MTKYNFDAKKIAADLGITTATIYKRIRDGWDINDAISVGHIPQKERIYNHNKKYDANIPLLEKLCNDLMCAAIQPTAGQRKGDETKGSVYWSEELDLLPWHIAIEACALVLSRKLEELKK